MIPLATTELGTDSWITELVTPVMGSMGLQPGWILVYTAFLMMVLRFLAGPIVHRLQPLGLLAVSAAIAIVGLLFLSKAVGILIFVAATVYGIGKTFFWPTMLGVVAERFPKGGALTLNTISGVGMLSVGVIGAAFLGNIQDKQIDHTLYDRNPALHAQVIGEEKTSLFGKYNALDQGKLEALEEGDKGIIATVTDFAKKQALVTVAIFPTIMLICYLILIFYFKAKGGYKPVELVEQKE
jgi:fucose permease